MKNNYKLLIMIFLFLPDIVHCQFERLNQNEAMLGGSFGLTWIDGRPHYAFRIFPEIQFSKVGIGLDLNLEFTPEGKIRKENFNEFSDYLSIIRYIRYGKKHDPLYFRIGALDYATLGHGSIMYLYNNSPAFDTRKIGTEFDIDFNNFGFESVYGNFGQSGVMGLRGYIRPIRFTELSSVPILGNLELGATLTTDSDEKSGIIAGDYNSYNNTFLPLIDEGKITIVGLDVGLPLLRTNLLDFDVYFDHSKIIKFGSGSALGLIADFKGLSLISLKAKLERRFNGKMYLPSYFNSLYEIERFRIDKSTGIVISKIQKLKSANEGNGYFGELLLNFLGAYNILGSFQKLDKMPESGILHLWTIIDLENLPYLFRAGYDKMQIKNFADIFKMDNRSYLFAEFGYKIQKYFLLSVVYSWTYTPLRDKTDNIIGYKPQKKIEPRLSFIYPVGI
ncbi:hypothetical protein VJY32_04290 [Ignavibacteria bacterium 4148-Me]|uniref:hypothetical protein n=1 Tax=Rosettibacter primus TaxID=3111523 RepID=UPI00336C2031